MIRKLTRITPVVEGYAVVVAQEQSIDSKPGKYLGCFLQTPENPDDGPFTLLAEAMGAYLKLTDKPTPSSNAAFSAATDVHQHL